jgi:hypothetical protein
MMLCRRAESLTGSRAEGDGAAERGNLYTL